MGCLPAPVYNEIVLHSLRLLDTSKRLRRHIAKAIGELIAPERQSEHVSETRSSWIQLAMTAMCSSHCISLI